MELFDTGLSRRLARLSSSHASLQWIFSQVHLCDATCVDRLSPLYLGQGVI